MEAVATVLPLGVWMTGADARPVAPLRPLHSADGVSDADLVERARGGDRWAEEALYRRHVRYIAGTAVRLLGRQNDAEDVVQETFAVALENLGSLRDGAAVRGWLAQIAVSLVRRRFRRRKLLRALGLDRGQDDATLESLAANTCSPEARAELSALDRLLARLPADQRIAWMLRRVEGWALEEVAEACGCSLATAKRRISAAEQAVAAFVSPPEAHADERAGEGSAP